MDHKKRHSWIQQDGFRIDKCEHCEATRRWDDGFKRLIYFTDQGNGPFFWAPTCISILTNAK
jgi:hypothetical protein